MTSLLFNFIIGFAFGVSVGLIIASLHLRKDRKDLEEKIKFIVRYGGK